MTVITHHRTATARACANIALIKYWGKRDAVLNLPAAGSLSLTLAALITETTVRFDDALAHDQLVLDGKLASTSESRRTSLWLDEVRRLAGIGSFASIESRNHFPTASGLASSASGFAALALAATKAAGIDVSHRELSILARRGSGSAARSIYSEFVRMHAGQSVDGNDAYAEPIASPLASSVRMIICIVGGGAAKSHGSRDAMDHTEATSPLYRAWIDCVPGDLARAEQALADGDLTSLGEVAEANALAMHACAIAARPAVLYWQPTTLALLHKVRELRAQGVVGWATMDAGPHVKVLTDAETAGSLAAVLRSTPGVSDVLISEAGAGASLVTTP
jgi:diphosphomevalonate decarboxylase